MCGVQDLSFGARAWWSRRCGALRFEVWWLCQPYASSIKRYGCQPRLCLCRIELRMSMEPGTNRQNSVISAMHSCDHSTLCSSASALLLGLLRRQLNRFQSLVQILCHQSASAWLVPGNRGAREQVLGWRSLGLRAVAPNLTELPCVMQPNLRAAELAIAR
jgi:hypothetical protein